MSEYLGTIEAILKGEPISMEQFIAHFDVQNRNPSPGPRVGERLPSFTLRDQSNAARQVDDLTGGAGLLLVLVRSVDWCGYCRNQLVELNEAVETAANAGVAIVAIAPDDLALIQPFAQAQSIRYPILSDPGAAFIERIGLLNPNVDGNPAQNGGRIPFPAHLLLSPDGVVIRSDVAHDLRHRLSGSVLAFEHFGSGGGPAVTLRSDVVDITIELSAPAVLVGQELGVRVTLEIRDGWRIYAAPAPAGQTALDVRFDETHLSAQSITLPPPASAAEGRPAYSGVVVAHGRVRLAWSHPRHGIPHLRGVSDELARRAMPAGEYLLEGKISYQACAEDLCMPPASAGFALPITIRPDVVRTARNDLAVITDIAAGDD